MESPLDVNPEGNIYYADVKSLFGIKIITGNVETLDHHVMDALRFIYYIKHCKISKAITYIKSYTNCGNMSILAHYAIESKNPMVDKVVGMLMTGMSSKTIAVMLRTGKTDLPQLYKVLNMNNESMHGGAYKWELRVPTNRISDWNVRMCACGYHLTDDPFQWVNLPCRIYKARGDTLCAVESDKYVFTSAEIYEEIEYAYLYYYTRLIRDGNSVAKVIGLVDNAYGVTPKDYSLIGLREMLKLSIPDKAKTMFQAYIYMYD